MTPFALVFVLLAAGTLAAFALPPRTAAGGTWLLLTRGCGLKAWIAAGTLAGSIHRMLTGPLPPIGAFDFELTPLAALFAFVTVAVFAVALPFQLRDCLTRRATYRMATNGAAGPGVFGLVMWVTGLVPLLGRVSTSIVGADSTVALVPAFFGHVNVSAASVVHDLTQVAGQLGRGVLPLRGLVLLHSDGTRAPVVYAMSTAISFAVLTLMLLIVWLVTRVLRRHRRVERRIPWNGGTPRLQPAVSYTATNFAAPVRVLFHAVFDSQVSRQERHQGAFLTARQDREVAPATGRSRAHSPAGDLAQRLAGRLADLHHGKVTAYAGYVLASLIVVMLATRILYLP